MQRCEEVRKGGLKKNIIGLQGKHSPEKISWSARFREKPRTIFKGSIGIKRGDHGAEDEYSSHGTHGFHGPQGFEGSYWVARF